MTKRLIVAASIACGCATDDAPADTDAGSSSAGPASGMTGASTTASTTESTVTTADDASTSGPSSSDSSGVETETDTGEPPADPCEGLVTDLADHPQSAVTQPGVGESFVDPEFGTTIVRVTQSTSGGAIVPMYSTIPAWNADESYLLLYDIGGGHRLYDGRDYADIGPLAIDPPDLEQVFWDPVDPASLLFVDDTNTLVSFDVDTMTKTTIRGFDCAGRVDAGDDPMYPSWDLDVFGFRCDAEGFTYRVSTDTIGATAPVGDLAPQISASGMFATLDGRVVDLDLQPVRDLDVANGYEHASHGRLPDGSDAYFAVAYDPGPSGGGVGTVVAYPLETGTANVLVGEPAYPYPPSGVHVSAVALAQRGWVVASAVGSGDGQSLLDGELLLVEAEAGGRVCRVAHHRSQESVDYWGEPHPVPSPSGTRILFGSDWGGDSADSYVVELPAYEP